MQSAVVYRNVMVPMRDGVRLATDVYLPNASGQFALLLMRTPYDKLRLTEQGARTVQHGFGMAIQDSRGRYASEGRFFSMQDDGPDGWDTLAWLGRQPWCNGRIGMHGTSYLGAVQMMLAPLHPPHLLSAFSQQPSSDEFTDRTFHSGALTLANVEGWAVNSSGEQYNRRLPDEQRQRAEHELRYYRELGPKALEVLPLEDVPWLRLIPPIWQDVLDHVEDPRFFAANDIRSKVNQVRVPICHVGGWFDPFLRNTIDHYTGAVAVQPDQRLILGPWTHGGMTQSTAGQTQFDDAAFDDFGYSLAWHDRWLRNGAGHPAQRHPVLVYVMGANRWRAEAAWPLPGTQVTPFYLRADGGLSRVAPAQEAPDQYVYDPHHPVPSPPAGPSSANALLQRSDVRVHTTPPLDESVEVTGEINATLFAASSAQDTDWMVWLVDLAPDGQAFHVVDGIMRARYRRSRTQPSPLAPGAVERYDINLWATSLVFARGHRIGVVVSSSNFPRYDRHPNVYADLRKTTENDFAAAVQTVHHSQEYPSAIHLPVIRTQEHHEWVANPMPFRGVPALDAPLHELPGADLPCVAL